MSDEQKLTTKGKRIYFVEFLRIFLILSVFLVHVGDWIDPELKNNVLALCHTQTWKLSHAVRYFFIIGGFFMYRKFTKAEQVNVIESIGKLWIRLMPGVIFFYLMLVILGARMWWSFPFAFFPTGGYGITGELIGYADWFIGVYFIVGCLFVGLFSVHQRSAWIWIIMGMFVCWWLEMNAKSEKGLGMGGEYFGFLAGGTVEGFSCMSLGMVAAFFCEQWDLRKTLFLRLFATALEIVALLMIVNYMYRPSCVYYNPIAVELVVAALLISSSHNWGYISAILNRFSSVMYFSRYTYSILLAQGALVHFFHRNQNFGLDSHTCSLIILGSAIPLVLIEYHLIEKWLVPKLKLFFVKEPTVS